MEEPSYLEELIRGGESDCVEFKSERPASDKKYLKTVVAFANGKGGHLLFGIEDGGRSVVGVPEDEVFRMMDTLVNSVADSCTPPIVPAQRLFTLHGKRVIEMEVLPGQNKPYYLRREGMPAGVYVRSGATTRRAEPEQVQSLILQGRNLSYDEQPTGAPPLSPEAVDGLCRRIGKRAGKTVTPENLESWGVLVRQGENFLPTHAFDLLAGRSTHFATVQCACFKGTQKGRFIDRMDAEGPIDEQVEQAFRFVLRNIRLRTRIDGLYRVEDYEVPEAALREAIVNAVVHRDYLKHAFIQVAVYDDRVEVSSPGGLYGGLTLAQALRGGSSYRNRVLAELFFKMDLVEHWGSGISKMCDSCRAAAVSEPTFADDGESFVVTFRRQENAGEPETVLPPPPVSRRKLTANEVAILNYLKEHESIANRQARELTGLSASGVAALLARLVSERYVEVSGEIRTRLYHLSPSMKGVSLTPPSVDS